MSKLDGKIALITGGTTGLGFATAERFLSEGAEVIITGRRQAELDSAVKRLGKKVLGVQGDVSKLADLDRLYATIQKEKGHLDIVFANAGGGSFAPLGAITEGHFDQIFDINPTFSTEREKLRFFVINFPLGRLDKGTKAPQCL
jgi:NAD(P)-dependent dehydrogenase (short-subunit alcohol dehydrogenase family)